MGVRPNVMSGLALHFTSIISGASYQPIRQMVQLSLTAGLNIGVPCSGRGI